MKIRYWLKENKYKIKDFAKKLNINKDYFNTIVNDRQIPSNGLIAKIIEITNGEVDANSFFEKELKKANSKNFLSIKNR